MVALVGGGVVITYVSTNTTFCRAVSLPVQQYWQFCDQLYLRHLLKVRIPVPSDIPRTISDAAPISLDFI